MRLNISILLFLTLQFLFSQQKNADQVLDEVVVSSTKINLPFSKNFRTIEIISSEQIALSAATNVSDLLQQTIGIDIRKRGVSGTQGDLYIRGGGFDQTLLLIDGMKMDDAQTGHHTLNMILPLYLIERIEIIKGPAARIFGQNAFNGAINIVTKEVKTETRKADVVLRELSFGSYGQKNLALSSSIIKEKIKSIVSFTTNRSDGYRHNTDYINNNYFSKTSFITKTSPVDLISSFSYRKFGANGFYASPLATEQYEETQASLLGVSTVIKSENLIIKPRLYWKRGQDEYIYIRDNPSIYRNLHKTNKISAELSGSYFTKLGTTGFGLDLSTVSITSNNLGEHSRTTVNFFVDHTFEMFDKKLSMSPGIAISHFSDLSFHSFPGIDIGYHLNSKVKLYSNIGKTYRIPTYTDLFYSSNTTIGNENLIPEQATSTEFGFKYNTSKLDFSTTIFSRKAKNIIDYVKKNENDLWKATNIGSLNTTGFELDLLYKFASKEGFSNSFSLGYSNLKDDNYVSNINYSQYSLNSIKNHLISKLNLNYKKLSFSTVFKYVKRSDESNYSVLDSKIYYKSFFVNVNNILDTTYSETNLVPMPGRNMLLGFLYRIN
ncbi:MAG: TonB-dependent receptor [Cryomorphaceae bacterium BACL29 MAG-121220-bin8]|jgi:vitamin B12 transporter|nr:MAG: TonB-dependent receptor [Cryomorphaceae bacterium BACL29 MAG-121220-bin8]|tara:strand:- start:31413 stop:33230 length:1818 start_codon:yes stop_codon:yes gene_type:complete